MTDKNSVLKSLKDDDIAYVDLRFTDPRGKLQHVTVVADIVDDDFLEEGFMFDGSSIAGWKSIDKSDMKLMPDASSAYVDPFYAEKTLCLHCSVLEPDTNEPYDRDPRGTAEKAEAYLKQTGIGDTAYFGPEAEFFILDNVRYAVTPNNVSFHIDAVDAAWNTDTEYEMGNTGHRRRGEGRLLPGAAGGRRPGHPLRDALDHEAHGHQGRQAPPRGGLAPARARHDLHHAGGDGGQPAEIQVRHPQRRAGLRQDRDLHAQALLGRQRLGHARQHVGLEGRASRSSPATNTPTSPTRRSGSSAG